MWMCHNIIDDELLELDSITQIEESPFFPGEPFKRNEYETKNRKLVPNEICTPSIQGSAPHQSLLLIVFLTSIVVCLQLVLL